MKRCLLLLLLGCDRGAPGDHTVADAHAGHDAAPSAATDPHAGHEMAQSTATAPQAGHDAAPSAATDPHAGHAAASNGAPNAALQVTPSAAALLDMRLATVRAGTASIPHRAPASVTFDPSAAVRVTSQAGGQVRSLDVPAPGTVVTRGQVLARIYDPVLHGILDELKVARDLAEPWRSAAASRARASGVPEADVRAVLAGGAVPDTTAIRSPIAGVVTVRPIAEGAWLGPGGLLATIVDPSAVLVDLVVDGPPPEGVVILRDPAGSSVTTATIVAVLPDATPAGVKVRVRPAIAVAPGRPLVAEWNVETPASLWIPTSALVDTGTRRVVFVATAEGFEPRPVEPGQRAGDEIEIRAGLAEGERVVVSAAFLLDSETQIGAMGHAGHGG